MSDDPETLPEIAVNWLQTTQEFPVRDTIAHDTVSTQDPRARAAIQILARLAEGKDLELGAPIGEGGMSIVRLGRQVALGREVAVKALRPGEAESEQEATLHMLREAWITGALGHPNVVPVHDISLDESGKPRIILKRIAGSPWLSSRSRASRGTSGRSSRSATPWPSRIRAASSIAISRATT